MARAATTVVAVVVMSFMLADFLLAICVTSYYAGVFLPIWNEGSRPECCLA